MILILKTTAIPSVSVNRVVKLLASCRSAITGSAANSSPPRLNLAQEAPGTLRSVHDGGAIHATRAEMEAGSVITS